MTLRGQPAKHDDQGFTLVELLVVLVVLPLLLGAIAEALIVSVENSAATSNRFSDSVNAQAMSAYFIRDVQGAAWFTTKKALYNAANTYSATTPTVCGSGASPGTLLAALYRPVSTGSPQALDVGYWLQQNGNGPTQTAQIVRYACTSSTTTTVQVTTAPPGSFTGNNTQGALTSQVDITPARFLTTSQSGWAQTSAFALVNAPSTLPTLTVNSTTDFVPGTITVNTAFGPQTLTCSSIPSPTQFTCSGSGSFFPGDSVTQSAISGVSVSVASPASNWTFTLTGSPRASAQAQAGGLPPPGGAPTFLTLGAGGIYVQDHIAALSVAGSVLADGGTLTCSGSAKNGPLAGITGTVQSTGADNNCQPPATGGVAPIGNPIATKLPPCFPDLSPPPSGTPPGSHQDGSGNYLPGKYTNLSGALTPGVYEVDGTLGAVTLATSAPADQGVLLLLPGSGAGYPSGCAFTTSPATLQPGTVLPPLGNGPLPSVFNTWATEMRTMWLWQDQTNLDPITWTGNGVTASTCPAGSTHAGSPAGLAYAPSANVNLGGTAHLQSGSLAVASANNVFGDNTVVLSGIASCN